MNLYFADTVQGLAVSAAPCRSETPSGAKHIHTWRAVATQAQQRGKWEEDDVLLKKQLVLVWGAYMCHGLWYGLFHLSVYVFLFRFLNANKVVCGQSSVNAFVFATTFARSSGARLME